MKRPGALVAAVSAILATGSALASSTTKIVVRLAPIHDVTIALPQAVNPVSGGTNAPFYDFGPNLEASLAEKMQNTHFILDQSGNQYGATDATPALKPSLPQPSPSPTAPDQWDGSSVYPAATFKFTIDALSLRTGANGDTMFYGFDERLRSPFNDGMNSEPNEFPLSVIQFQHWFDRTFQDRGTAPLDAYSGLDLGQGFQLNALVAWIDVKYATYHAAIRMHVEMDAPLAHRHEVKTVQVTGGGYYYDVVGGYELWSGGIGLARTDAMTAAFKNVFAGSFSAIDSWVRNLPLTARLYGYQSEQKIFLNTGPDSNVPVGTRYASVDNPNLVFEVTQAVPSGSIARLDSGSLKDLRLGMILLEQKAGVIANTRKDTSSDVPALVANEDIKLPNTNLPKSNFAGNGYNVQEGFWQGFLNTVIDLPFLPYRIWRYFQYDQAYKGPDWQKKPQYGSPGCDAGTIEPCLSHGNLSQMAALFPEMQAKDAPSEDLPYNSEGWAIRLKAEPWAQQIGLSTASPMTQEGPVVAVIDSGVDYNHSTLNERIWVNPSPVVDPEGNSDANGWDFVSGDPRPYDDNYHGTEVASTIVGVAPLVKIMPLKVFNPFGVTSSAVIYGAFQYAVDHGAKIIVAAWATQKQTHTIEMAIRYAHDHGVLVIVSAGDRGDDLGKAPSYPAVLSKTFDNVVTVTGVDTQDQLVKVNQFYANYDPAAVSIAAPGENILVAQPRQHTFRDTSTSLAAGIVAGAVARNWAASFGAGSYLDWIHQLKSQAQAVPSLSAAVQGGLSLRIK